MITDQDYWDEQQKLIESQAAEIERLKDIESEMLMIGVERAKNQFQDEIASQAAEIVKYKALCDQMGVAISKCRFDSLNMSVQDMVQASSAFAAWRAMK